MTRHLVFFKMKPEAQGKNALDNAQAMANKFRAISSQIPGVCSVELGMNFNSEENFYEMALNQVFESREALENYIVDPRHVEVRDFVRLVIDHRIIIDYDI